MAKKLLRKIACGALAAVSTLGCAATFTACETSNPEVTMQIAFQGETYNLKYKLYRKITPSTVDHFLWLVENHYYDNTCIHDYDADQLKMYAGAFEVDESKDSGIAYKRYFDVVKAYENLSSFPHSVWDDEDKTTPTYTLYGEFMDGNRFEVKNGNLKQSFGSLTMYYTNISNYNAADHSVYVVRNSDGTLDEREYRYNSATSQFFISLSTSQTSSSAYCTFATLKNTSVLEDLQDAIADYIDDTYGTDADDEDEFVKSATLRVSEDDPILADYEIEKTFSVPQAPIVINHIKVTKY